MTLPLAISLASYDGGRAAGVQWTILYSPEDFAFVTVSAGPAALAAGKTISCAGGDGSQTCLVYGLNSTAISDGVVAIVSAQAAATSSNQQAPMQLVNAVAVSAGGAVIPASSAGGAVSSVQPTRLAGLACDSSWIVTPGATSCTVSLTSAAPSEAVTVSLASNSPNLAVPEAVTVPPGALSVRFTATALAVITNTPVQLTAVWGGNFQTFVLTLAIPALGVPALNSLSCDATTLSGATTTWCTVGLTAPAPGEGVTVSLFSNSPNLVVPEAVTVPPGALSARFTVTALAVTATTSVQLTAALGGIPRTFALTLAALTPGSPPPAGSTLNSFSCNVTTLSGAASTWCTVGLTAAAPSGGVTVAISPGSSSLAAPSTVLVPAGAISAGFAVNASAVAVLTMTQVNVSLSGTTRAVILILTPAAPTRLLSLQCNPAELIGPGSTVCTVALSGPAPDDGATVLLAASPALPGLPGSVRFYPGAESATFSVTVPGVTTTTRVQITATWGGSALTFELTLRPPFIDFVIL